MALLIGCGSGGGGASGPADWSKAPLDVTLEGKAGDQALSIKVPKDFVGESTKYTYDIDYRTGGRTYSPKMSVSVSADPKTLADEIKSEKKVFEQQETADGFYFSFENSDPTDLYTVVVRNTASGAIRCRTRVSPLAKADTAETIKGRLPAARAICATVQLK